MISLIALQFFPSRANLHSIPPFFLPSEMIASPVLFQNSGSEEDMKKQVEEALKPHLQEGNTPLFKSCQPDAGKVVFKVGATGVLWSLSGISVASIARCAVPLFIRIQLFFFGPQFSPNYVFLTFRHATSLTMQRVFKVL